VEKYEGKDRVRVKDTITVRDKSKVRVKVNAVELGYES
jgi:hypothetical protein